MNVLTAASVIVALQFCSGLSHAQLINPFPYETQEGLTRDDMDMVRSQSDMVNKVAQADAPTSWKNPATGNSGTIGFVRHLERQGMDCNLLRYTFAGTTPRHDTAYNLNWCRVGDEWKLAD